MNRPTSNPTGVSVTVSALRKSFGEQAVLNDIDFEVAGGEIFVLMGPSGSGKSVLLRHLIGLETPDEGGIMINGESLEISGVRSRCRMAMVFQSSALLHSLTVEENVGLYLREHRMKKEAEIARIVSEKLAAVGLEGVEHKYPNELSGGMKKRVAIARALVAEPQLILYDEPTSELDPLMAATVGREIVDLQRKTGVTSIIVSHDRDLALGIADRVAIIQEGRILAIGAPAEIQQCQIPAVQRFISADYNHQPERNL